MIYKRKCFSLLHEQGEAFLSTVYLLSVLCLTHIFPKRNRWGDAKLIDEIISSTCNLMSATLSLVSIFSKFRKAALQQILVYKEHSM